MMVCAEPDNLTSPVSYLWNYPFVVNLSYPDYSQSLVNHSSEFIAKNIPFDAVASPDDFPLINNQNLVITLIIIYLCFIIKIIPSLMSSRLPYNLRPWLVVFNGLMFGAYSAGFCIFVYCFPPWRYAMYGEDATLETPLTKVYYMYVHNLIFWARLVDLAVPVFKLLMKKDSTETILHAVYTSIIVTAYSLGYELESKEPYTFLPMFDALKVIFRMFYHILTAPGEKSLMLDGINKSKIHWINVFINAIGLSVIGYLFTTNYNFSRTLYSWVVIITLSETLFHIFGIFNINLPSTSQSSKQSSKFID
ncbi:uncharacterized protein LOC112538830 [Tetranychus urticae]|uniref:uncharacterized protein LOC112538830 n=1 Tax=Tetranychus urticae TaxID=32264 RepID=UPI000D6561B1|nr:uncharacterized protein LOC112538830 [Tetranychus urticae]XP_025016565.1 uncharacterized protein LOC112538830 [Tetranychus urticae]